MTPTRAIITVSSLFSLLLLSACFGKGDIRETCDDPQPYESVVASKRVVVPEGLDPLDDFKEMPVPKATTPPRPEDSDCLESPPSILTGKPSD